MLFTPSERVLNKYCFFFLLIRCHKALDYARDNFSHDRIVYDTLDVEHHDPESLTERYGAFDRVYSFLAFHYVADIAKAYSNIFKLLKGGGECLVLSIVKADAIEVWNEAYQMEEWNELMIVSVTGRRNFTNSGVC